MASTMDWIEMERPADRDRRKGKYVHLEGPDAREYVVAAPYEEAAYHAEIVARFLESRGLRAYHLATDGQWCEVHEPGWKVLGGGHYRLKPGSGRPELGGRSQCYGAADHERLIRALGVVE